MVNRKLLDPDSSPAAALGARLRMLREARGWTQDELAEIIGCTGSHVSAVETGRRPATQQFAASADRALGTGDRLEQQSLAVRKSALLEGFPEYVNQERRAVEIRLFETGLIPGPLQTREYAAALESGNVRRGTITPEQAEERVTFLIDRQAALVRSLPPVMFVVLDESCIRREIGGPHIMAAQLESLIRFAEQPHTSLQLAPFPLGERRPFSRSVNLLTMTDGAVLAYLESEAHGYLDRESPSVQRLMREYHQLQTEALSQADSVAMIAEAVRKGTP
ncbi:helix-turn-helix transcriptional regulator [Streptomyces sp. NPDC049906]|uniref:helix-turn-helix domain-containing protein n=1 Tax=Streptomyces sp. NPDC049906 TaxID=3155656 RepID=UPI00343026D9